MTPESELLSVDDMVARYKGKITAGTLANWRIKKEGPPFMKLGGRVMYPLDLLIKWEQSRLKMTVVAAVSAIMSWPVFRAVTETTAYI